MLAIIGILVVIGSVLGGFAMVKGPFATLLQPAELVTIFGAAIGTALISTPVKVLKALGAAMPVIFKGSPYTKATYVELLTMQFEVFSKMRKNGLLALEEDVADPAASATFQNYPKFLGNKKAVTFFCDSLKLLIDGTDAGDAEHIMMSDMATQQEEIALPPAVLAKVGDAMPALGIVAAVMGIVVTMSHLDAPPEVLGHHVAAALVGTFLGILFSYGFFQPLAGAVESIARDENKYMQCMMVGLISSAQGASPRTAIEQVRRVIYTADRPSSVDVAEAVNSIKSRV
ncbi:MAG: flagellar motor stator protein MotA [bacterium]|nr:flagellar motor stator protein MotA [bacterium]